LGKNKGQKGCIRGSGSKNIGMIRGGGREGVEGGESMVNGYVGGVKGVWGERERGGEQWGEHVGGELQ